MTVLSAKNTPRNSYTATGGQTDFTIGFEFFAVADVKVFKNATLMTYNADPSSTTTYKITGITNTSDEAYEFGNGGTVTFGSGLTAGDVVVIIRDIVVERTADFNPSGAFDVTSLNTQLDTIISMIADTQTQTERSVKLRDHDAVSANIELPVKNTRAGKVLAFDSVGDVETTLTTTGLETIGTITSEIVTVASNNSNINTVAGISSNITTVAGISSNVTAVADNTTNINAVNSNSSNINTVASANSNISTVAGANSNISTLAGINSDITTVAGISSNVTTVAGISSAVSTVASANSNISTVASGISNINTVAGSISNVNTVAGSISNVNTVASNVSGVNSFAERYRVGSSDPSSSLDAGDLFFNTTSNTLKFYDSSSWNVVASTFTIDGASDTNLTSPADGALLLYDAGTSKFIDNVVSGDATLADTGVLTIADDAVTYAKIQNVSATDRILGRDSAGAGVIEEITPANLRTMINVADGANAYTHPNHTGEVTSTADGATVIADDVVDEANLKVSNSPVNGYMLTAQSGASGGLTWAEAPSGGGFSLASALSGTTPTINWSSATAFSHTLSGDTTYSFSNVPSGGEIELFLKNVGKTMDVLSFNATTDLDLSGTLSTGGSFGSWFNNDGSRWYVTDNATNNPIREFNLSTNYSISTASLSRTSSGSLPNTLRYSCEFNGDGTKLIGYKADLVEHSLTSAYDISSLSTSTNHTIDVDALFQSSGGGDSVTGFGGGTIRFNNDGTRLFISQRDNDDIEVPRAIVVKLSTAYDIDSTLTVESQWFRQPFQDLGREYVSATKLTTVLSYDGTTIVCAEHNDQAEEVGHAHFWHYNLSIPWDLSSSRFVGSVKQDLNASAATGIENLHITPDNKFMYFTEFKTSSSDNDYFQVFDIQGGHKVTFPSGVTTLPASFGDGEDPTTTSYLRLVSLDGSNVLITDHREIL